MIYKYLVMIGAFIMVSDEFIKDEKINKIVNIVLIVLLIGLITYDIIKYKSKKLSRTRRNWFTPKNR